jgi:ATP-dependent helicase/nuclease subunit A
MAEELRVLYVALTRAKEHQILIGTCDEKAVDKWRTFWGDHRGRFPADAVLGAGTPLEWVGPAAVSLDAEGRAAFELIPHTAAEVSAWGVTATRKAELTPWQAARAALMPLDPPPAANPAAQEAIARLGYRYPFEAFTRLRAAEAATDRAKSRAAVPSTIARVNHLLPLPRCVSGHVAMTATERGTATHLVLQHLDFRNGTGEALRKQISQMESRRLITGGQLAAVDVDAVEWFAGSDLGQMIASAEAADVMREVPFAVALSDGGKRQGLDQPMLRGRIDLLIRRGRQCEIVDYKTDRVNADELRERTELYRKQLAVYREAVRRTTGYEVSTIYLAFLTAREVIAL